MTVKTLMDQLKSFPEDMEVLLKSEDEITTSSYILVEIRGYETYTKTGYHPFDEVMGLSDNEAVMIVGRT
jgi:hypothetical protein